MKLTKTHRRFKMVRHGLVPRSKLFYIHTGFANYEDYRDSLIKAVEDHDANINATVNRILNNVLRGIRGERNG